MYWFLATKNYVLPRGATVVIATLKMHRRPELYPNPDVFDPDRFLPENTQQRHYYSFIPFSAGPRSCVGKMIISFSKIMFFYIFIYTYIPNFNQSSDFTRFNFSKNYYGTFII